MRGLMNDSKPSDDTEERWERWIERNPSFVPSFQRAFRHLAERGLTHLDENNTSDVVISQLLIGALDDFDAVMTLCSSSRILAAHKLLRSLFERIVTAKYLSENPSEVENFVEFNALHWNNVLTRIKEQFGFSMSLKVEIILRPSTYRHEGTSGRKSAQPAA